MPAFISVNRYLSYLYALTKTAILLVVGLVVSHLFVATIFVVEGASMVPNLTDGEIVLVNRLIYTFGQPRRGDIVVLRYPGDPDHRTFVKRVVARPGEKVTVDRGRLIINDQPLLESYLASTLPTDRDQEIVVPPNEYYTLGDNRPVSNDSRVFGTTPRRFLVGRVSAIFFPLGQARIIPKVFY